MIEAAPRYLKQRDKYNCAPISILNAQKWLGQKVTYRDLPKMSKRCRVVKREGSGGMHFDVAVLKTLRYNVEFFVVAPTVDFVADYIKNGGAVIITYDFYHKKDKEYHAHCILVTEYKKRKFTIINDGIDIRGNVNRPTVSNMTISDFDKYRLKLSTDYSDNCRYPRVWFLKK